MRAWYLSLGLLMIGGLLSCGHRNEAPLVILITVDSLRWDALGAYGNQRGLTPNLDDFAAQSTRFERAYATSSWTKPSMVSVMSGMLPSEHLVLLSGLQVHLQRAREFAKDSTREQLLGEIEKRLARLAYVPSDVPLFHEYLDGYARGAFVNNPHLHRQFGLDRGWDEYAFFPSKTFQRGQMFANTPIMNARALQFMDDRLGACFTWLHYNDVHYPYGPLEPSLGQIRSQPVPFEMSRYDIHMHESLARQDDPETNQLLRDFYAAGVRQFDAHLGQLFAGLKERGLFDRALIVITADHGEEFREHGEMGHGNNLFDSTLRVPLLLKLPGQREMRVRSDVVSIADVGPSVLTHCGQLDLSPYAARGAPLLTQDGPRKTVAAQLLSNDLRQLYALIDGKEKLIVEPVSGRRYLFLITPDGREIEVEKAEAAHLDELERDLLAAVGDYDFIALCDGKPMPMGQSPEMDPDVVEQLRSLGYVQ